ncbi:hypothetical protein HCH_01506 [Hahella chejuensis KCTC 2396]|uniref:Uncharacterized protein n=1 Tax=Hahella chejuensis (strain KCTC 2396) TaxID=349521 RepID=Q2SLW0_HAHCH|nr:hypothetical protein [Hahella chejuensis]ABC28364.1 hypothetical protein HCH_01506 [Hahella chejuensis KCTC 2396]
MVSRIKPGLIVRTFIWRTLAIFTLVFWWRPGVPGKREGWISPLAEGWIRDRLDGVLPQVLEEMCGVSSGWRGTLLKLGVGLCERPVKAKLVDRVMRELRGAMREMSEG